MRVSRPERKCACTPGAAEESGSEEGAKDAHCSGWGGLLLRAVQFEVGGFGGREAGEDKIVDRGEDLAAEEEGASLCLLNWGCCRVLGAGAGVGVGCCDSCRGEIGGESWARDA